jgi:hypothetical protein
MREEMKRGEAEASAAIEDAPTTERRNAES